MFLRGNCTVLSCPDSPSWLVGNENERARHIRLHERVNALPDANYSTLKYLMGHLHKCVTLSPTPALPLPFPRRAPSADPRPSHAPPLPAESLTCATPPLSRPRRRNRVTQHEAQNSMSAQNLAIVFGPTLFNGMLSAMADTSLQNRVRGTPPSARRASVCALPLTRRAPLPLSFHRPSRRFSSTTPTSSSTRATSPRPTPAHIGL